MLASSHCYDSDGVASEAMVEYWGRGVCYASSVWGSALDSPAHCGMRDVPWGGRWGQDLVPVRSVWGQGEGPQGCVYSWLWVCSHPLRLDRAAFGLGAGAAQGWEGAGDM